MSQTTAERWRTVERLEHQGDEYLLQQQMRATQSPAEEGTGSTTEGFSILPESTHRIVRLDAVIDRDARTDATS